MGVGDKVADFFGQFFPLGGRQVRFAAHQFLECAQYLLATVAFVCGDITTLADDGTVGGGMTTLV